MKNREARTTVLIPARIRAGGAWTDVRIRNVSSRGLMLEIRFPLDRGTYLEIARTRLRITGRVVWSASGRCGIQTRDDIDLGTLTDEAQDKPAVTVLPAKIEASATTRAQAGRDRSRTLGRLMEFVAVAAFAMGGAGFLSHVVYVQIASTVEIVKAKL